MVATVYRLLLGGIRLKVLNLVQGGRQSNRRSMENCASIMQDDGVYICTNETES